MNELALFNDLFDGFEDDGYLMPSINLKKAFAYPKVDVKEEKNAYILEMEIPGLTEKEINIELDQRTLTISSVHMSKNEDKKDEKKDCKYLIKERAYSAFNRSFTIPEDVDGENLTAKVSNGVLTVTMMRKAVCEPKHIVITAA